MDCCVNIGFCSATEVTAFLIHRHGKDYVTKRISKNAYYCNRERAEEIRREQDARERLIFSPKSISRPNTPKHFLTYRK